MKKTKFLAIGLIATLIVGCTNDDDATPIEPITPNEEELITTVKVIFNDSLGVMKDAFSFNDLDGDGGNAPTIDTIRLSRGTDYSIVLQFQDASDSSDIEDITAEIREEDDEHLICFELSDMYGLTIDRTDSDGTNEVGLESNWSLNSRATSFNNANVKITLKHQPDVKDGTCSPGDTDVEVVFPVIIN